MKMVNAVNRLSVSGVIGGVLIMTMLFVYTDCTTLGVPDIKGTIMSLLDPIKSLIVGIKNSTEKLTEKITSVAESTGSLKSTLTNIPKSVADKMSMSLEPLSKVAESLGDIPKTLRSVLNDTLGELLRNLSPEALIKKGTDLLAKDYDKIVVVVTDILLDTVVNVFTVVTRKHPNLLLSIYIGGALIVGITIILIVVTVCLVCMVRSKINTLLKRVK